MSQFKELKGAGSLSQVAHLLDIKPGMLSFQLYKVPQAAKYKKFEIAKRFGGKREIWAPNKDLKLIQHRLSELLQNCADEINTAHGRTESAMRPGISHGFKRAHSIMTNANEHVGRRSVFNVDLHDFFGTINFGRVRGFFIKNRNFSLHPSVATVLAQIACHENKLPQGSPCSPVISNLIGHTLDIPLARLAKATNCMYTRYADDLTFSTNKPKFSSRVAIRPNPNMEAWNPGHGLKRLVAEAGFSINERKTRMQYRDSRQDVTGLVVNRKVNVPASYRHTVRSMASTLFRIGQFYVPCRRDDGKGGFVEAKRTGHVGQLIGMLSHIDRVDLFNRETCLRVGTTPTETPGRVKLLRQVLYFDAFYRPSLPVVVCEGKTDNVYLKCAIRRLARHFPTLVEPGTPPKLRVRLFRYSERRAGKVTELEGGVGGLCKLIKHYFSDLESKFRAAPPKHPVIVLIDNDLGADKVLGAVAGITKKNKASREAPFIHVCSNLYVVPTPLTADGRHTSIEDFFDAETLDTKLNEKSFNRSKEADANKHYGKAAFARDVIAKRVDKIDFSRFRGILERVDAVIADYAKHHPAEVPADGK
jgi:RNA-directed DNA polymerase